MSEQVCALWRREDVLSLLGVEPTVPRLTSPHIGTKCGSIIVMRIRLYCVKGDVIIPLSVVYFTVFMRLEVFCLQVGRIFHASVFERDHFPQSAKP